MTHCTKLAALAKARGTITALDAARAFQLNPNHASKLIWHAIRGGYLVRAQPGHYRAVERSQ